MRKVRSTFFWQPLRRPAFLATVAAFALLGAGGPALGWQITPPDPATKAAYEKRQAAKAKLASALARIAANGSDTSALLEAGRASIDLDDHRAALGFLIRAEQGAPRDGAVKAALGSVMVRMENPQRALDYFGEAQLAGAPERLFLADRGLAHDLLGQQDAAQRDYQLALTVGPNEDVQRRYALSLGISGQADQAVNMLAPQLRAQSRAAWRTRALILAINGREKEATDIVKATMPPELATSILPYLTQLDRLPPPQQAAAAHFGRFPTGPLPARRDRTQIAAATPPPATEPPARGRTDRSKRTPVAKATPAPAPIATRPRAPAPTPAPPPARAVPSTPKQVPPTLPVRVAEPFKPAATPTPPPLRTPTPVPAPTPTPALAAPSAANPVIAQPNPAPPPSAVVQGPVDGAVTPGFSIARISATTASAAPLASLADIVSSIEIPAEEMTRAPDAIGAATLARLQEEKRKEEAAAEAKRAKDAEAAKAKAAAEAKAKAEAEEKKANPARNWVQVATGANPKALAFDFRRLVKKYPEAFKGQDGATATWNSTRRLLVGPFKDRKAAQAWLTDYKKSGGDAFLFNSEAGETVDPIK